MYHTFASAKQPTPDLAQIASCPGLTASAAPHSLAVVEPDVGSLRRRALRAALLLAGLAALAGCQARREPNVLVVVIDALRPDHLGCYGYARATSPTVDGLARRGVLFADATTVATYTRASVPSIFTSVYPAAHGVLSQGTRVEVLADEYTTLAEALKARGYRTAAFMPNPSLHRVFKFGQGFDLYDDDFALGPGAADQAYETASRINARFLRWLRSGRRAPFFAYLHYRDVHAPYVPPPPYDRMFAGAGPRRPLSAAEYQAQPADLRSPRRFSDLGSYIDQYDGEIRYTDDRLGELLATLRAEGLLDHTVVVVTADHGEAFLEHGAWTHGTDLYEEQTRVPLLLVLPDGAQGGRRVLSPVQTIDVYPTVLALLGAPVSAQVQGRSLLPTLDGRGDPHRPVFSEARVPRKKRPNGRGLLVSVRADGWKLIYNRTKRKAELYRVAEDPGEGNDLVAHLPQKAQELARLLQAFDQDNARHSHWQQGRQAVPQDVVEGLRALGYVQ